MAAITACMTAQLSDSLLLFQVLLLADNIIVKQLLLDKETNTVGSICIKHMNNFSEFVKVCQVMRWNFTTKYAKFH